MGEDLQGRPCRRCWGLIAPNKANLVRASGEGKHFVRRELRRIGPAKGLGQTKPIPARPAMAKGRHGCQCRRWDPSRETKPIPPERSEGASALWKKSYDELDRQRTSAKQSQFRPVRPTRWIWSPPPYAGHTRALLRVLFWWTACRRAGTEEGRRSSDGLAQKLRQKIREPLIP